MLLKILKGHVGILGAYTNTYLVYDEKTLEGVLIDIANNFSSIQEFIESRQIKLKYLILTHCHADHIGGLKELKNKYPETKILIHELDASGLVNDTINLSSALEAEPNFVVADRTLKDGDTIPVGKLELKIIHTPGHTAGSISILVEDALFTGDTLMKGGYGRTDFPTGDAWAMRKSIEKLLEYPSNTILYPGHGEISILEEEK